MNNEKKKSVEVLGPEDFANKQTTASSKEEWGIGAVATPIQETEKKSPKKAIIIAATIAALLVSAAALVYGILNYEFSAVPAAEKTAAESTTQVEVMNEEVPGEVIVVEIPEFKGKTLAQAEKILRKQNIEYKVYEEYSDDIKKGKIISQSIDGGTKVSEDAVIHLTVSLGKKVTEKTVADKPQATEKEAVSISVVYIERETKAPVSNPPATMPAETRPAPTTQAPTRPVDTTPATRPAPTTQAPATTKAPVVKYKVTFNANGGTVNEASRYVQKDGVYGTLPIPTRSGFTFDGWYTDGGAEVYASTEIAYNREHTLVARWTENEFSGWVDSLPSNVNSDDYIIQYRFREKEFTTSTKSSLDGWTQYGEPSITYSEWKKGNWSGWSTNSKTASKTDTQWVEVESKTIYRYYYYACKSCGNRQPIWDTNCVKCGKYVDNSVRDYYWTTTSYKDSKSSKDPYFSYKRKTTSVKGSEVWFFSDGNLNDTAPGTKDAAGPNVIIQKGYRSRTNTRTKTVTYNYFRWSEWVVMDSPVSETSNRQVQYNYRQK